MKKKLSLYLQLAVSILLVIYFASSVDIGRISWPIPTLGWLYIVLTVMLVNLDRILMAYKWNILLQVKGIALSFGEVVRSYYIGTFWGIFLPSSVGGDVVRAYRVSRQTNNTKEIVSSVIIERLLGMISMFLMGILSAGLFVMLVRPGNWMIVASLLVSFFLFMGLVFLSFNTRSVKWFDQQFRFHKKGWIGKLAEIYSAYQAYQNHRRPMLRFLLWSLLEQCVPIVCVFFVSQALNLNIPFWSFIIFVPVIIGISKLPVSIDGFGVREGLFVYFFFFVGVTGSSAFLLGFIAHIVAMVSVLPGFFYFSFFSPEPEVITSSLSS